MSFFSVTQHTPLSYDYVLVAKTIDNQEREAFKKQIEYIEELKKKNIKVTVSVYLNKDLSYCLFSLTVLGKCGLQRS